MRNLLHDTVTLVKQNGERIPDIRASVQRDMIFTDNAEIAIEDGDVFERDLPSGITESYVVRDAGFYTGSGGIKSHYQSKVEKTQNVPTSSTIEMPSANSLSLFVSHSSRDRDVVTALVDLLRAALNLSSSEIRCTSVDGYRLPGGANTNDQLRLEVHDANAFVGVISASSLDSMYVTFELGARWGAGKHLIPLLVHGTETRVLSGPLAGINALRLDNAAQLQQLVTDLATELSVSAEPPSAYQKYVDALINASVTQSQNVEPPTDDDPASNQDFRELERIQHALENFHSNPEGIYYIGQTLVQLDAILERLHVEGAAAELVDQLMHELDADARKEMGALDPVVSVSKVRDLRKSLNQLKESLASDLQSREKA